MGLIRNDSDGFGRHPLRRRRICASSSDRSSRSRRAWCAIRFGAGGICGSDMHYFRHARTGDFVVTSPLVLGHEIAGEVVEIAAAPRDRASRPGDPGRRQPVALVRPLRAVPRGPANLCENIYFMGSASKTPHMQGGFASFFDAVPAQCVKVPDRRAVSGGGAGRAARGLPACRRPRRRHQRAERAVVFGAGPIGLLTMLAARRAGAAEVTVVDIAAAPLAFATRLGADHVVDVSGGDDGLKALAATSPFDVAFEVSGTAAGLASRDSALSGAAARGPDRQSAGRPDCRARQCRHGQGDRPSRLASASAANS